MLLNILSSLTIPWMMGQLVDHMNQPFQAVMQWILYVSIVLVFNFIIDWRQNLLWFSYIFEAVEITRNNLFQLVLCNQGSYFKFVKTGDLVNIIINDGALYGQYLAITDLMIAINSLQVLIILGMILTMSITIGSIITALTILYFLSYQHLNKKMRQTSLAERECFSEILELSTHFIRGIHTIQAFQQIPFFSKLFSKTARQHAQAMIAQQKHVSFSQSFANFVINGMPIIALLVGALMVQHLRLSIGTIIAIYAFIPYIGEPIQNLTNVNITIQNAQSLKTRIQSVLPEKTPAPQQDKISTINHLELQNITVSFDNTTIFDHFSIQLKKGDVVVVTGPSGIGKSSLFQVILGILIPDEGTILVNHQPLTARNQQLYQKSLAVVFQDTFLHTGNVKENIDFKQPNQKKWQHLQQIIPFRSLMNQQSSAAFSGGERQRIGLARALFKDSDILLLDEPTSNLDHSTEQDIIHAIAQEKLLENKITIIATHGTQLQQLATALLSYKEGNWQLSTP